MSDLGDPHLTGVVREAFSALAAEGPWPLAGVAAAGERSGTWLTEASASSSFHIGQVTKTFTGLLLAIMATRGQVNLDDPVGRYLPSASGPGPTLAQLACHTSGYPRVPHSIQFRMMLRLRDPYSLVRDRHVDGAVRRLSRQAAGGPHPFRYSNFGYGVLGRALSAAGGLPFGELLAGEVLRPLGLAGVTLETAPDPGRHRLFGHNFSGEQLEHWRNPALAGASSLFSTVEGMRRYLLVNIHAEKTPLRVPLQLAQEPRAQAEPGLQASLGWLVSDTGAGPLHWHNGGAAGFGSFIGFDTARKVGVAVLLARRHGPDLDEAARTALAVLAAA